MPFLRAAVAPSRAAQFDLLPLCSRRDSCTFKEFSFTATPFKVFDQSRNDYAVHTCKYLKESLCIFEISKLKTSHTFLLLLLILFLFFFTMSFLLFMSVDISRFSNG